jgi:hypothetical protein
VIGARRAALASSTAHHQAINNGHLHHGLLREAFLPVNMAPVDEYSFSYSANARGQSLVRRDRKPADPVAVAAWCLFSSPWILGSLP